MAQSLVSTDIAVDAYKRLRRAERRVEQLRIELENVLRDPNVDLATYVKATEEEHQRV